jgi:acyl-CoA reductase-like NAD-dependent aldehyde dehydrogenase
MIAKYNAVLMLAWKIGPALATGNTIVMKCSEFTPLTALFMCKLSVQAGIPPGVFNLLVGYGETVGAAVSSHMDIQKVAFTGSTIVGRKITEAAAKSNLKNVTLELGGKSPNIIFDDCEIEQAINWTTFGILCVHLIYFMANLCGTDIDSWQLEPGPDLLCRFEDFRSRQDLRRVFAEVHGED